MSRPYAVFRSHRHHDQHDLARIKVLMNVILPQAYFQAVHVPCFASLPYHDRHIYLETRGRFRIHGTKVAEMIL